MAFDVVVVQRPEFDAWLTAQAESAQVPAAPLAAQGARAFLANGCTACHTIRGTPAAGRIGPDLTHVGSRVSLAAGILPNNAGTLASWISASQQLKPGNLMPSMGVFSGADLRALVGYLESLE
jgi:cytochrome c oxidase subunit 2